jgi:hypothetical protein
MGLRGWSLGVKEVRLEERQSMLGVHKSQEVQEACEHSINAFNHNIESIRDFRTLRNCLLQSYDFYAQIRPYRQLVHRRPRHC